jgi:holo-[acyl-carrier protein] synthase
MKIIGIGTDIVEIARLKESLKRFHSAFYERICSADELFYAGSRKDDVNFLAGRWAAKEAAAKALGCGIGRYCSFTDIEIFNNAAGRPEMSFTGKAKHYFHTLGGTTINLSISHEKNYAVATVLLTGEEKENGEKK